MTNPSNDLVLSDRNKTTPSERIQTTNPIGQNVETTQNAADYQLPSLKDIKPTDNLVAGRIKHFYSNWTLITSNPWILSIVQGYKIPFVRHPIQWRQRQTKAKSKEDLASIKEAIIQLQAKGAVKAVQEETNQFTSTLFIVKQASKNRPIFNLKNLNRFVQSQKFKMEGLEAVRKLIQPGDFMMKLDLQDAYFFHTDSQQSQEISEVCFPRNNIRVPMPAIRAIQCTQDIYKTIETGHGIATTTRNTDCNISGRYAYSGPKPRKTVVNFSECCQSTTTSGIYHQTGEMLPSPIPVSRVPGILDQLEGDDTSCTQRQTPKAPNRVQECTPKLLAHTERTLGLIRQDEPLLPSGSSPGPFALSCSAEATYQQHSPEQTSLEQDEGLFDKRITNRPPMVDFDADTSVQQVFNLSTGVRPGHLHRRIQSRMGSTVQRHVSHDRGTMETSKNPDNTSTFSK